MKPDLVILVGFMGTGKTEVGALLAERMGVPFVDLDAEIESVAGCSIPEIFAKEGEAGFRVWERHQLLQALQAAEGVVSCGGGVVVTPENLSDLKAQSHVYCLTATPETIVKRVGNDPNRPLLQAEGDLVAHVRSLLQKRADLYDQLLCHIATDDFRPSEVVEYLLSELRKEE